MLKRIEEIEEILESPLLEFSSENQFWPKLLETLCKTFDCGWGTYWQVNGLALSSAAIWSSAGINAQELSIDTRSRSLSLSQGNAGHVWRSRKPIWTTNIALDMCLPRSTEAESADLHGGIWFAVKTDLVVYGVVELLGKNLNPAGEEPLLAIEKMGLKLGKAIFESEKSQNKS